MFFWHGCLSFWSLTQLMALSHIDNVGESVLQAQNGMIFSLKGSTRLGFANTLTFRDKLEHIQNAY